MPFSQIEQWVERHYPSFISITGGSGALQTGINGSDIRARIVKRNLEIDQRHEKERREAAGVPAPPKQDDSWPWELFAFVGGMLAFVIALGAVIVWFIITFLPN